MRRRPRVTLAVTMAVAALLAAACGDDSSDEAAEGELQFGDPEPGDLDVDVPDGWRLIPLDDLGFGLAVPEDWQDTVISADALEALALASPTVPDFNSLAEEAGAAGAVFYAAGIDPEDAEAVNDLKVRPFLETAEDAPVSDATELEAFAQEHADTSELDDVDVQPVEDWRFPAVDVRYSATYDDLGAEDEAEEITAHGVDRLVLAPSGLVFSVMVTGEDAETVDALAAELFATFDFA